MPLLTKVLKAALRPEQRKVRGKAFECINDIGEIVGKEMFAKDAKEVMDAMLPVFQAGFAADDVLRESCFKGIGKMARIIGKDLKPYVGAALPTIFEVLKKEPQPVNPGLDDDE